MKSHILILTALVATLGAEGALAAKSKCAFREETDDFFSGVPTFRTAWTQVNPGDCKGDCNARGSLSIVKETGGQWVEFDAWFTKSYVFVPTQAELDSSFVVTSAAKLVVTLADGTLVELPIVAPVDGPTRITYPYENNNDNYLDLYVSCLNADNKLFKNNGPGKSGEWSFSEVAEQAVVTKPKSSFPTWFFDYDKFLDTLLNYFQVLILLLYLL